LLSLRQRRNLGAPDWTCDELTPDLCDDLEVAEEGSIPVRGGLHVHYWKYESQSSADAEEDDAVPIVAIHGGPGWPHNYMLPLKQQACRGRPVYFYDQAGCGESKLPKHTTSSVADEYPWLLTPEYYATEELPAVLKFFGLEGRPYHLIGNSWGTVLAQLFVLDAAASYENVTNGLQSMILSGPLSDARLYIKSQWAPIDGSLGSLPPFLQKRILQLEDEGAYNSDEYQAIVDTLTTKFTIRTAPFPDCFLDAARGVNEEIYVGMQGASEFTIAGALGTLNITHRLVNIDVPVLLTHGIYDTMRPAVVQAMYEQFPKAESLLLAKSAHISMIDEPQRMNHAVADFLDRVEQQGHQFVAKLSLEFSKGNGPTQQLTLHDGLVPVWFPWQHLPMVIVALTILIVAFGLGLTVGQHRERRHRREDYDVVP